MHSHLRTAPVKIPAMPAYALTIFLGAFLLFQVQPLIGKYILPWFGGAPAVWTTCLLFFQALLLGGYAYAYCSARWLKPRAQVICHALLVIIALALLPIIPPDVWKPDGPGAPALRILAILGASLGVPYLVLSSTGPLLQHWFSRAHPGVAPYRLYALSNAGSLLALVTFPFWFEAHFTRQDQARLWGWGLLAYAIASGFCAAGYWRAEHGAATPAEPGRALERPASGMPSGERWVVLDHWLCLLLPACASVLLLATTNKLCQDVAVIPFLWVLPLSLYLLSFIICFDSPRWYQRALFIPALSLSWGAFCILSAGPAAPIQTQIAVYSAGLFVCCMVCHGELYRLKPDPRHLTGYYLLIAAGGALGGLFVACIAPVIFNDYFELHAGLLLSGLLLLVVGFRNWTRPELRRWRIPAACWVAICLAALGLWTAGQLRRAHRPSAQTSRSFYGVLTVSQRVAEETGERFLRLNHGRTTHGMQLVDPERAALPTAYYNEKSGVGLAWAELPASPRRVGLVGLGIGTLAAYARPGDYIRVYEINPEVIRLAYSRFAFLSNCPAKLEMLPGDARLSLEREPPQAFDLLALDAFNSDAVPVHLLTREAFLIYGRHLKTNGIIAVHVSNLGVNLEPVVANAARDLQYKLRTIEYVPAPNEWWIGPSVWMLLSRDGAVLDRPALRAAARPADTGSKPVRLWTDDFAGLFPIMRTKPEPVDADYEEARSQVAYGLSERGDVAGAVAFLRAALETHPDAPNLLNNLAWLLATAPDPSIRNGPEAVRLAERACSLTHYRVMPVVDTLAAAYAEAGRTDDAILMAEKACRFAADTGDPAAVENAEKTLAGYLARRTPGGP